MDHELNIRQSRVFFCTFTNVGILHGYWASKVTCPLIPCMTSLKVILLGEKEGGDVRSTSISPSFLFSFHPIPSVQQFCLGEGVPFCKMGTVVKSRNIAICLILSQTVTPSSLVLYMLTGSSSPQTLQVEALWNLRNVAMQVKACVWLSLQRDFCHLRSRHRPTIALHSGQRGHSRAIIAMALSLFNSEMRVLVGLSVLSTRKSPRAIRNPLASINLQGQTVQWNLHSYKGKLERGHRNPPYFRTISLVIRGKNQTKGTSTKVTSYV